MKSLFSANFTTDLLSPNQFGVGTRGGVEPIVRGQYNTPPTNTQLFHTGTSPP